MLSEQHTKRHLLMEGALNVRDIGGYATQHGKITSWRKVVRSDNLDAITEADQLQLQNYPVGTVIDLRTGWEVEKYPDLMSKVETVTYRNLPLYDLDLIEGFKPLVTMLDINQYILEKAQPQLRAILEQIADTAPDKAVLLHCSAGKDRTGLIITLLLALVGVAPSDIAEDYTLTNHYLAPKVAQWRQVALAQGKDMAQFEIDTMAYPETMLDTLAWLEEAYGDVRHYLESIGLSEDSLAKLEARLVAEVESSN